MEKGAVHVRQLVRLAPHDVIIEVSFSVIVCT